jgi:hypothetical protein
MRRADHLRKINDNGITTLALDKNVEFIEIAMYEARMCKPDD